MTHTITSVAVRDIRTPTSRTLAGSDAMHTDPDYSATYVVIRTDNADKLEGHTSSVSVIGVAPLQFQAAGSIGFCYGQ